MRVVGARGCLGEENLLSGSIACVTAEPILDSARFPGLRWRHPLA
jgi:hypothetical protein